MLAVSVNCMLGVSAKGMLLILCFWRRVCKLYLADEQYKLARLLGDPLGSCLVGVGLVPGPGQLAQAHCHALLHLAKPSLNIASCLQTALAFSPPT